MADPWQLALLRRSVKEWNAWREAHPHIKVNLSGADLSRANLSGAYLHRHLGEADLSGADLSGADLNGANLSGADLSGAPIFEARLSRANLSGANLSRASLSRADLSGADLSGADLSGADLSGADLTGIKRGIPPPKSPTPKSQPSQSSSTINWLGLVETIGENLLLTAASFAAIIQGLDVVERRWREKNEKQKRQGTPPASPSSQKTPVSDSEIIEIRLVMDDGSHHTFKRWISDPDTLRAYIDAFSDPTSKVKPLQVVFMKRKGRALVVNVTEGGKDNPQINVILSYLEADPQP
jgi:uncharacterized protein YjbI with pentapeptide repeats